jgi:hypothetical protein
MAAEKEKNEKAKEITFHQIKSNEYKTVYASGAIGGITVNSLININFFSERPPIPNELTYEINDKGQLGKEIGRISKKGIVRDIQVGVFMDISGAKSLIEWLNEQIIKVEKLNKNKK